MTELDLTVLGVIARDGPMSAYDVRQAFARSLTPGWSSSSGSIYPSVRRLAQRAYIEACEPQGGRGRQSLNVTATGRAAVQAWMTELTSTLAAATPDPLRTRAHFLVLLPEQSRAQFAAAALAHTEAAIAEAEAVHSELASRPYGRLEYLGSLGALFELRARRDWLLAIYQELA